MGLRRRQGRRRQDHLQLHPLRPPRRGPPVRASHLHRPRAQPQRRLPAALHQVPHPRPRIHQPLRHGNKYNTKKNSKIPPILFSVLRLQSTLLAGSSSVDPTQFGGACEDWMGRLRVLANGDCLIKLDLTVPIFGRGCQQGCLSF